ncbi:MAG: CDP-alcohol phosphatidyltransferase family protein [Candidatus Omnitrophica bacterium]|nr:CDP-alcohol phosphatidyltransferase family protein [Candidatus Omnitrophota bacterium]
MLTSRYKPRLNRLLDPLARRLAQMGVSPATLTLLGPLLGSLACALFVRTRAVAPFCVAMAVVGCFDGLDGAVARASGRVTKLGAYLDAMADRYVEIIVVLAAAVVTGYWALSMVALAGSLLVSYAKARAAMEVPVSNLEWPDLMERAYWTLSMVALAGSLLVSYAKARAAMEVPVSNLEWPDLMERAERSVLFLGGLAAGAVVPWRPRGKDLFWWTLALLAILLSVTVLQRILRARRLILDRS